MACTTYKPRSFAIYNESCVLYSFLLPIMIPLSKATQVLDFNVSIIYKSIKASHDLKHLSKNKAVKAYTDIKDVKTF